MKSKLVVTLLFIAVVLGLTSCKSSKSAITTSNTSYTENTQKYDAVVGKYFTWNTFSSKGKITLNAGGRTSSGMEMRMVRGKYILISLRPLLGLELGKLYINNDSIFVQDKYNKCFVGDKLSKFTMGFPFNINMMQDLFLGRAFSAKSGTLTKKDANYVKVTDEADGEWRITPSDKVMDYTYSFLFDKLNEMIGLQVAHNNQAQPYTVSYSDYQTTVLGICPSNVDIMAVIENKPFGLSVALDNGKIKWNQPLNDTMEVGSNYRRMTLPEYMTVLKNM